MEHNQVQLQVCTIWITKLKKSYLILKSMQSWNSFESQVCDSFEYQVCNCFESEVWIYFESQAWNYYENWLWNPFELYVYILFNIRLLFSHTGTKSFDLKTLTHLMSLIFLYTFWKIFHIFRGCIKVLMTLSVLSRKFLHIYYFFDWINSYNKLQKILRQL